MVIDLLTFFQACCQSAVCLDLAIRRCRSREAAAREAAAFLFPQEPVTVLGQIGAQLGQGCFGTVYELRRPGHSCFMLYVVFLSVLAAWPVFTLKLRWGLLQVMATAWWSNVPETMAPWPATTSRFCWKKPNELLACATFLNLCHSMHSSLVPFNTLHAWAILHLEAPARSVQREPNEPK